MSDLTAWTFTACLILAIGSYLGALTTRDTWRTRRAMQIRGRTSGLEWMLAHANARTELFIVLGLSVNLLIYTTVLVMELSEQRQILTRVSAISIALVLMLKGVCDRRDRTKIAHLQTRPTLLIPPDLAEAGGTIVLEQIAAELYARLLRDEILKPYFEGVSLAHLIHAQADLLARILSHQLSNVDLRAAHAHLHIPPAHFEHFVEMLRETLDDFANMPDVLRDQILAIVVSVRDEIIDPEYREQIVTRTP